jgi:hypothetical protein
MKMIILMLLTKMIDKRYQVDEIQRLSLPNVEVSQHG